MQKYINEYMGQLVGGLTMELAQYRAQCDQLQAENAKLRKQVEQLTKGPESQARSSSTSAAR